MAVTQQDLQKWLGPGWRLTPVRVNDGDWSKPEWRAEFLCRNARLGSHYVYDEPALNGEQLIVFAVH